MRTTLKHLTGLISLFLLLLLTACASEPIIDTRVVEVPVEVYVPIPSEFTRPLERPQLPTGTLVNEDIVEYIEQLEARLRMCIDHRREIRQLQE